MGPEAKPPPVTAFSRCDFCGRDNPITEDWMPTSCKHCGRLHFPTNSRSRRFATAAGLGALAVLTLLFWWMVL